MINYYTSKLNLIQENLTLSIYFCLWPFLCIICKRSTEIEFRNINKFYTRSVVQPKASWWFTEGFSLHPLLEILKAKRRENKNPLTETNSTITEIKNTLEAINSRISEAEEQISELEDKMVEITSEEQNKVKEKNWGYSQESSRTISNPPTFKL